MRMHSTGKTVTKRGLTPMEYQMKLVHTSHILKSGTEFWILWNAASSSPPRLAYSTEEEAYQVAEVLATQHPTEKFYVMRMVGCVKVEQPVVRIAPVKALSVAAVGKLRDPKVGKRAKR